jgi:hypothetical protein
MPVEPFDVTDENGVRVTGTAEAYRDPNGPFYDPNSEFYKNERYSDRYINYLNTRDVCRINRSVLSAAVEKAFRTALIRLGIPDPKESAVNVDIDKSITETLRQCALSPDKYVSNQLSSSADSKSGKPAGELSPNPPNSGVQPLSFASALPQVAFPLEALLSPDRTRALNDWASSAPRRPIIQAAPSAALQKPQTSMADLIMDYIGRQKQENPVQPQPSVFDTGAASLPFISTTGLAPSGTEQLADDLARDKSPIRRLTRVQAG